MSATTWRLPDWRERFPRGVLDPTDLDGVPIATPTDHRLLWHIESALPGAPNGSQLDRLRQELRSYLNDTCQHHWRPYAGDEVIPAHTQCLWCCSVEWLDDVSLPDTEGTPA